MGMVFSRRITSPMPYPPSPVMGEGAMGDARSTCFPKSDMVPPLQLARRQCGARARELPCSPVQSRSPCRPARIDESTPESRTAWVAEQRDDSRVASATRLLRPHDLQEVEHLRREAPLVVV